MIPDVPTDHYHLLVDAALKDGPDDPGLSEWNEAHCFYLPSLGLQPSPTVSSFPPAPQLYICQWKGNRDERSPSSGPFGPWRGTCRTSLIGSGNLYLVEVISDLLVASASHPSHWPTVGKGHTAGEGGGVI